MSDKDHMPKPKDPLKTLLRESAMEQAPESLVSNVMRAIDAETRATQMGKPLISTIGWVLIGTFLAALSLLSVLLDDRGAGPEYLDAVAGWIGNLRFPSARYSNLPETVWLGALAFGIYGLLQLFWIKRQLDRQHLF